MGGLNMRFTTGVSFGTALLAVGYLGPALSAAQLSTAADSEAYPEHSAGDPELQVVVVNGYRRSLQDAQSKKRAASQIVDSIVADDIGKLPDTNTAEALQRVPGVQINTDLGEGSTVVIRGLGQVETLLDGRETFTAAGTRTLNFEFIPSELLSGVDVYKTPSAEQVEGALGGLINVRTRRPLEFDGLTAQAAVLGNLGDLARKSRPQLSALLSDRWRVSGGELGALLSASYQERQLQEDYISAGAPTCYGPVAAGVCTSGIIGPNGFFNPQYTAERRRMGFNGALQWRPGERVELYLDGNYMRFETPQLDFGTYPLPNGNLTRSATRLFPGTNLIESATYLQQPLHTLSINRFQKDTEWQAAIGAKWAAGPLAVKADLSYLNTKEQLRYNELDLQTTLPTFSIDTSGSPPAQSYSGVDLGNIANYTFSGLTNSVNLWAGRETALQLDASFDLGWGPVRSLELGARYADLDDGLTPTRYFNTPANRPAATNSGLIEQYPLGTAFASAGGSTINSYLTVNPALLQNIDTVIAALGLTQYPVVQSQGIYTIRERDSAAHLKVNFVSGGRARVDGNLGLRLVHTGDSLSGTETISAPVTLYQPLRLANNYSKLLPSSNLRAHLSETVLLRLAAYASITRPEFSNLNPGLTLVPANLTGSQGNPQLAPYTATNYDATLEWYFAEAGSIHGNAFFKRVRGFPFTAGTSRVVGGSSYIISQPLNSGAGKVGGFEGGYQQFYTWLPRPFSGLGLQANLTYVNSSTPTAVAGYTAPLPNLSRWSYNTVAIYERARWSGRIAYFWRSQFLQSIAVASGVGVVPVESESFGQLTAALNYRPSEHCTLTLAGTNLTRAKHQTFIGSVHSPSATYIDDRQYLAGIRYRF
jgi:iron complex outermembrane recepter protein